MFKYLFSLIIAFIVLNEAYNYSSPSKITESLVSHTNDDNTQKVSFFEKENVPNDSKGYDINTLLPQNQNKEVIFDKQNPWSKLVIQNGTEFPFNYYIPVNIPSLNDFQNWKNLVPNLDFNPNSGELIIPSKDEGSALALANLIIANLFNQITINEIVEKQLIQISVAKAQAHELVRIKLREQILDNLHGGKIVNVPTTNYEKDLATVNKVTNKIDIDLPANIDSYNNKKPVQVNEGEFEAFENGDGYSYL
jgi:hypothetical protein